MRTTKHLLAGSASSALLALTMAVLPPPSQAQAPLPIAGDAAAVLPPVALKTPKFNSALLAPVEGFSVRQYAHLVFRMFADDTTDNARLFASVGLTQDKFNRINEAMIQRMRDDPTRKFIDIYGAYYIETAGGPFAAYAKDVANSVLNDVALREKDPYSWEEYMRLQGYYARKAPFARDTSRAAYDEILSDQGMTFIDFQVLGAWFGRKLAQRTR